MWIVKPDNVSYETRFVFSTLDDAKAFVKCYEKASMKAEIDSDFNIIGFSKSEPIRFEVWKDNEKLIKQTSKSVCNITEDEEDSF